MGSTLTSLSRRDPHAAANIMEARSNWYEALQQLNIAIADEQQQSIPPLLHRIADISSYLLAEHGGTGG